MADAEPDFHFYEPLNGHGLAHDPFNSIVGPRPIGWISSLDKAGRVNLAPYSFFNAFNYVPPIVGFSSITNKDTVANVEATGEFVWNLTTRDLVRAMNVSCYPAPHGQSEFDLAGLEMLPSRVVAPPRVARSPVHFECRVTQILQLVDTEGKPTPARMTFGEVVAVHIRRDMLDNGIYRTARARPVLRGGGRGDYFQIEPENLFEILRPTEVSQIPDLLRDD